MTTTTSPCEFRLGYPAPGTSEKAYAAADLRRAIEAHVSDVSKWSGFAAFGLRHTKVV